MITILSPAKRLDFKEKKNDLPYTVPSNLDISEKIINKLRSLSPSKLSKLMNISDKLTKENYERYLKWSPDFTIDNAKQALLAFRGDVYFGLQADKFSREDLDFAQDHVRILSGLHGILRPMDLIQPYRLEMATKITLGKTNDLYEQWGNIITEHLSNTLAGHEHKVIVNLASNEYFSSIDKDQLKARIIQPDFREFKDGKYKFVHIFGKRARGMMTRFIIKNKINHPDKMKLFDLDGYEYNDRLSEKDKWVFTRG